MDYGENDYVNPFGYNLPEGYMTDPSTGLPAPDPGYTPDPTAPKSSAPPFVQSGGQKAAKANYIDYVRWKRKELENLLNRYRTAFPKQIEAYKTAAYGALPEKQKDLWGNMYANLAQRGLNESGSFLGGARKDLETWLTGEKSGIESTAQGMEQSAQAAMLAAIGRPQYAQLYQQWNAFDTQMNDALFKNWISDVKGDTH